MLNKLSLFLKSTPANQQSIENTAIKNAENVPSKEATIVSIDNRVVRLFQSISIDDNASNSLDEEVGIDVTDPSYLQGFFRDQKRLSVKSALKIVTQAMQILRNEPNLLTVKAPVTVCGDVHGQYYDLLQILKMIGPPGVDSSYLFLGDYVDRGSFSCEILLLLLAYKIKYPNNVYLLRGNHETRSVSSYYGFKEECEMKYGTVVYNRCISCFQCLPLAAHISTNYGDFLALHGGLSPAIRLLEDIQNLNRFTEPGNLGALCDILWSDPAEDDANQDSESDWTPNQARGCSYNFSSSVATQFLHQNNLLSLIRAHELVETGFRAHFEHSNIHQEENLPSVLTVFSAPNYCNSHGNKGATLYIGPQRGSFKLQQYSSVLSPERIVLHSKTKEIYSYLQATVPYMPLYFREFVEAAKDIGPATFCSSIMKEIASNNQKEVLSPTFVPTVSSLNRHVTPFQFLLISNNKSVKSYGNVTSKIAKMHQMLALAHAAKSSPKSPRMNTSSQVRYIRPRRASIERLRSGISGRPPVAELRRRWELPQSHDNKKKNLTFDVSVRAFTDEELQGLKLLFEVLDRKGNKLVTTEDLFAYAEDSDDFAATSELTLLMDTIDADRSGGIEYADILQFAARLKKNCPSGVRT